MADEEELRRDRQEDEFAALQSIYSGDVVDLRKKDAWQVRRPPEMLFSLRPQQSNTMTEAYAKIDLYIKCPLAYPNVIPVIDLRNPKGLSDRKIKELQNQLVELAKTRVGEEMIYELCSHVEGFLHDNNLPPRPSFYDEMINEQKRQKEERQREDEKRHEVQRQLEEVQFKELEEQLKRKEQERKENAKRMRDVTKQLSCDRRSAGDMSAVLSEASQLYHRPRASLSPRSSEAENQYNSLCTRSISATISNSTESEPNAQLQTDEKAVTLKFSTDRERTVHRGKRIGGSTRGSRVFAGMDAETGALVAVTQWEIHWSPASGPGIKENNLHAKYKGQVLSVEKEVLCLVRLSHSNLVLYLGINHETKQQNMTVNVLSEFVGGGNLESCVRCGNALPLDRIRSYVQQTLEGLAYLHGKAIIHRSLRLSSLLLDAAGKVRIADYSIHKRLVDLVAEAENRKQKETPTDTKRSSIVKIDGRKEDIWQLGLVTLSLAVGANVTELPTDFSSHLPTEFLDFLKRCTDEDDVLRWSAVQLQDHVFIRTPVYGDLSISAASLPSRSSSSAVKKRPASSKAKDGENSDEMVDILLLQSISSESRLKKEFKILRRIGKGGFGDVIKVRNLLDNRCYAIKRISLKPAWHKQYKKLTREVEVLSKLNHENIVRYFNSWLETCEDNSSSDDASSSHTNTDSEEDETPSLSSSVESVIRRKTKVKPSSSQGLSEDGLGGQVEPLCDDDEGESSEDESSSSDDTDIEDVFGQSHRWMSTQDSDEEDSIIFEENSKESSSSSNTKAKVKTVPGSTGKDLSQLKTRTKRHRKGRQFLYIQMEFCEKSTLRDCIDSDLYRDVSRVWELFREIVEGLAHIHDQGIIHRDLKPVNIFLDSEYHVKIGDFGLATAFMDIVAEPPGASSSDVPSSRQSRDPGLQDEETSLTGKVGTALYVSPEMESTTKRYNLKVDIYSLGIIFFEMCYRPFTTGMERIKVLTNIRKESIDFPDDFDEICLPDQARIIRLLLCHDPFKRPSAKELLKSEYLPLSQMEESELYEVLDSTISNPEGRTYKHMLHKIFVQPVLTVTDFLYDADLFKTSFTRSQALVQQTVAATLERIFQHHGAIRFSVPLLMPTSSLYNCETYVTMMERSGGLVSLPYDTMVPFARFIARAKVPHHFKRYSIERVFRECRPSGVHPRELWAASFDIVRSPSGALLDDVEVIYAVYEITREFPVQSSCSYRLRLSHASLLKAILLHCGVPDEDCAQVGRLLGDSSVDRQIQRQRLVSIESVSECCVDLIFSFLQREDVFDKMASFLKCISKTKTQAASLAKKSLNEIESVIGHLNALGCTLQPLVSLSLVSNVRFFSGILFQVMLEGKRKKKATLGVLAVGGRYDNLVAMFRKPTERFSGCPQAVGVSIAFDKVVSLAVDSGHLDIVPSTEVLVSSIGCQSKKDVLIAARHFWDLGVAADVFHDTTSQGVDDVKSHCHKNAIPYLLTLAAKDEYQKEWTLIRMLEEKDKVLKKDKLLKEIVDSYLKDKREAAESSNKLQTSSIAQTPTDSIMSTGGGGGGGGLSSSSSFCNVTFILPESKESNRLQKNTKRAYETQIYAAIGRTLPYLNPKSRVEVIATELPANVLKTLVAHFDVNTDDASLLSTIGVKEGQKATNKKYISRVINEIKDNRSRLKPQTPIILYSLADEFHRVLLL